jgi:hypothetical protein
MYLRDVPSTSIVSSVRLIFSGAAAPPLLELLVPPLLVPPLLELLLEESDVLVQARRHATVPVIVRNEKQKSDRITRAYCRGGGRSSSSAAATGRSSS